MEEKIEGSLENPQGNKRIKERKKNLRTLKCLISHNIYLNICLSIKTYLYLSKNLIINMLVDF